MTAGATVAQADESPARLDATDTPEWTAYHEAGHATILPDEDSTGHTISGDPWEAVAHWDATGRWRDVDAALRARIMIYMAGAEAEAEFFGECAGGDGDDRREIDLTLDSLLPPDASFPAHEARLRRFTGGLVRRHRDKIEAVARELLRSKHLPGERIDALVVKDARVEARSER